MINDLESNILETDNIESTSDKFPLKRVEKLPGNQQNINIICMSTSKRYIYILTDHAELLCLESSTLRPIDKSFSINSNDINNPISKPFKENFTRIWTDREGNHSIIRFSGRIYYFNINGSTMKELNMFKGIEICAVSFDDNNNDDKTTGLFLATDYENNIYECTISIKIEKNGDYTIKDSKTIVSKLISKDWDSEEEEDITEKKPLKNDRIYGIKFFKTRKEKEKLSPNENIYYILATTRTRLYQFIGFGEASCKQMFGKFDDNPTLFNDCCKYFPQDLRKIKKFFNSDLKILYKNEDKVDQFGWITETGFCFGSYSYYTFLPDEVKKFTVIPFAKINSNGSKETGMEPISITHTQNHIFALYNDCLTIISKLTSNIIHTQYFQSEYKGVIYNEFFPNGGVILLYSKNGLYQISLKDENKDIYQDYLDIGEYEKSKNFCKDNNKLIRRINRINAEDYFNKKDYYNSISKYLDSDEKFENICLKYLMNDQLDSLKLYLELYSKQNCDEKNEYKLELNLISTLLVQVFLDKYKNDKKSNVEEFRQLIRENSKFLREGNIIYELLQSYGRMEEYVEYSSMMGDFERVILYLINQDKIGEALEKLTWFASFTDDKKAMKALSEIFVKNCHIFFKKNPKESISLLQQRFKDVEMNSIVQAIMSTTDKDIGDISSELKSNNITSLKASKKEDNSQAILGYLKSLVEKPKPKQDDDMHNIHNLYIYYLSKNNKNQEAIIEYLKGPLKSEEDQFSHKKREVLFQLDYAKKLFKNNPPAYSLVLALMGKYLEGVKTALSNKTEECQKIAKFIASNAPGDKLKKQLWIEIFSCDSQNEFQEALKIMKESKILKIEDVLPHITDTIKIEEFKKQISNCINDYEENIKKLKEDITDYNKTAENIKNDIIKVKKKSMEIQYSSCKCEICQGYIKDNNIYLFPCGHMFDANCIRKCLLDYEITGLDYIHKTNVDIDELFYELGYIDRRCFIENKNQNESDQNEEKKQQEEQQQGITSTFFNKIIEKIEFKKQDVSNPDEHNGNKDPKVLKAKLNKLLSKQCVLCGDYMVDSIQCSICKPELMEAKPDKFKLKIKESNNWDYIE